MKYGLPTTVEVGGKELEIRTDFRVILEIFEALNDPELDGYDRVEAVLGMFYVDPEEIDDIREAIEACFDFIDCGKTRDKKQPRVMDWEQDFEYIIAPVNRVLGFEARAVPYDPITNTGGLHWWTFVSAFMEIGGDCTLGQIIAIREKRARGESLTKEERKWAARNADIVHLKTHYSAAEESMLKEWGGGES